jgi:hypothetical protein
MKRLSIFTFRKKMLTKKSTFFRFSTFLHTPYHTCFDSLAARVERVHKKMRKKRGKTADFGSLFCEMERNRLAATC